MHLHYVVLCNKDLLTYLLTYLLNNDCKVVEYSYAQWRLHHINDGAMHH